MNDALDSVEESGVGAFGFDLGACREGYEGVTASVSKERTCEKGNIYVKAIDRIPPPAPDTAWAILSDCWVAVVEAILSSLGVLKGCENREARPHLNKVQKSSVNGFPCESEIKGRRSSDISRMHSNATRDLPRHWVECGETLELITCGEKVVYF